MLVWYAGREAGVSSPLRNEGFGIELCHGYWLAKSLNEGRSQREESVSFVANFFLNCEERSNQEVTQSLALSITGFPDLVHALA
jgi:hypothetical protein